MKKKLIITSIAVLAVLCMAAGCGKKPEEPVEASAAAVQEKAPKSVSVTLTKDQVQVLTDTKLLSGVQDYIVETGTDVDFAKLISYDKDVFESVDVDDKKVDYKKTGDYKVAYLLTIDKAALDKAMKGKEKTVSFPEAKDAETVLAGYESKISVMTKEAAEKAAATTGDTKPAVINIATYNETVKHNQENVSNRAQAQSAPVAAKVANSSSNPSNKPAQSAQSGNSSQQTKPSQSAQSSKSSQQTKPAKTTKPTQTTQPTQAAKPAQTTTPTQSTKPAQTTQPTQTTKPTQTTQPTQPSKPVQTTQPTQPTQQTKPVQATQPTQPSKPVQATQPTQPAQTTQQTEPQTEAPTQPVHEHYWVPVYRTETVDQGFYQEKWEPHQVCRGCGMIVDGMDDIELTRHLVTCGPGSHYSAMVSVGQFWTPVMVEQQVLDHYECSCGETKQP